MPAASPPDDEDDDFELELEAVDPAILEMERQRAQQKTDKAVASINPDELFPDEHSEGLGIDWEGLKKFRFTTRHLLILTAALAMVMTLFTLVENPCSGVFVLGVVALGAGWWWVMRQERQHELERARRRAEFFASRGASGEAPATAGASGSEAEAANAPRRRDFSFQFSMQEMLGAVTAAAVVMGLMVLMGPQRMAMLLGLVALAGVVLLMLVDVPRVVVLAWWILLLLYLAVGAIAALWGKDDGQTARRQIPATRPSAIARL